MKKQWHLHRPDSETVKAIQRRLNCSFITATVLSNRRIQSPQSAADFLSPSLSGLQSPFAMQDMDRAVERIVYALMNRERILIIGDYDVDGVTATAVLFIFLNGVGASVIYHIPHRIDEGYGFCADHIHKIAVPRGIQLIVTADNGSSSHAAVRKANSAGIDVIITDHHAISDHLPPATAVINPKRFDCNSKLDYLAGVGVAFSLLICLRKRLREKAFWPAQKEPNLKQWCDLVALGTVADMVPLIADNRILTHAGLKLINSTPRPGIRAMLDAFGNGKPYIDAEDIAFRLAPRLNAAGRMVHADIAMQLLLTRNPTNARSLSAELNHLNTLRKETENLIFETIKADVPEIDPDQKTIVASGLDWHIGVLGIVASKITNHFFKPAIVFSEKDGLAKGSARSIPGLDIHSALLSCQADLIKFGGHSSAAGVVLKCDRLPSFRERFEETVRSMTQEIDFTKKIIIDCEIFFDDINPQLMDELERLQPFGQGNPAPLFMAKNIKVLSEFPIGQSHRRLVLSQQGNPRKRFNAIQFNIPPDDKLSEQLNQIAFRLQWNHWNGSKKIQLVLEET